jgi:hypothetical protein
MLKIETCILYHTLAVTYTIMKKILNLHNLTVIKVKASLVKKTTIISNDNNKKLSIFTPKELFDLYKKC